MNESTAEFHWHINWPLTVMGLLLLVVLLRLGYWQLERAQEKTDINSALLVQQQQAAADLASITKRDLINYRRVQGTGYFGEQVWLLDNQVLRGRVGYHVIMPFTVANQDTVLVNRGWVQAPPTRDQLPQFETPSSLTQVSGRFYNPSDNKLAREIGGVDQWPRRIQKLNVEQLQDQLGMPTLPFIVQIDADSPGALSVQWHTLNTGSQKHTGYAVQWFAMAFVLSVALVFANSNVASFFKNNKTRESA